jgi:Flp pilus assembly protein protease CpaA
MRILLLISVMVTSGAVCYFDLHYRRIPNLFLPPLGALLFLSEEGNEGLETLTRPLAVVAVYLAIYLLSRKSLGAGDVKLAVILSIATDSWHTLYLIHLIAWASAGLYLSAVLVVGGRIRNRSVAFAPFLIVPTLWFLIATH